MTSFLFLSTLAFAGSVPVESEHIAEVGEEVVLNMGGAWARVLLTEPERTFLFASGGDYWRADLTDDYYVVQEERISLTGRDNLDDHTFVQCPDGSYLHAASGKTYEPNDSGYMFAYDSEFNRLHSHVIQEGTPKIAFNDMPLICHEKGRYVAFIDYDIWNAVAYRLDETGKPLESMKLPELGLPEGGSFLEDPIREDLALVTANHDKTALEVNWFDWELGFLETKTLFSIQYEDGSIYWPQAVKVIGDKIVVAYVNQPKNQGRVSDWGDMWLAILDHSWNVLENHQITADQGSDGSMRPGLKLDEDVLLYTYDEINHFPPGVVQPRLVPIRLKLGAFGLGVDTGEPPEPEDTSAPEDTHKEEEDTGQEDSTTSSCACASTGMQRKDPWAVAFFVLVGFVRTRRKT